MLTAPRLHTHARARARTRARARAHARARARAHARARARRARARRARVLLLSGGVGGCDGHPHDLATRLAELICIDEEPFLHLRVVLLCGSQNHR